MKLSDTADNAGSRKKRMRVGRGIGSGKGKTSGRGGKGQTARSGVRIKGFEGGQMPLHRRLPKRGFTNIFRTEYTVLGLDRIAELGEKELTLEVLSARGILKKRNGLVKVLANGELKSAVTVHAHKFSKGAQKAIEAAGGRAVVIGASNSEAAPAA
jgi:large subunit ribosomal protein L15